ncbi:MAG: Asp23/Gls24 family envelope stress response protein [Simkaniaceae bacterium]|nr:Asp23/Gls24 family envelope stress response protein [Simkaniaceae bacterium]MCF7851673.1 Asp23/Gls24 family envelope stress response protein [Simkaniaceae bacterium]
MKNEDQLSQLSKKDQMSFTEIDPKELNYADTVFVRDIETRVFQAITIKCLSNIEGISLLEGNLFDNLLGREGVERVKGIYVEQDSKSHSVNLKIELNIAYGISIPQKSEEIQSKLVDDIVKLTGLHVASVHIIFKNLLPEEDLENLLAEKMKDNATDEKEVSEETLNEYSEEF